MKPIFEPDLIAVAVVSDVGAGVLPSNAFFLSSSLRIEEGSHTLRIQAAALHQVDDSEAVGHSSLHVPDPEVKPLRVFFGVQVCAQGEFVLIDTPEQRRNTSEQIQQLNQMKVQFNKEGNVIADNLKQLICQ